MENPVEECDAVQVREEKRAMKKQKRKMELARSKMKACKDQPSMKDMLSAPTVSQDYKCEWDKPEDEQHQRANRGPHLSPGGRFSSFFVEKTKMLRIA
jgi:hypothetical protein